VFFSNAYVHLFISGFFSQYVQIKIKHFNMCNCTTRKLVLATLVTVAIVAAVFCWLYFTGTILSSNSETEGKYTLGIKHVYNLFCKLVIQYVLYNESCEKNVAREHCLVSVNRACANFGKQH
jgi:hypothetical protein